MSAENCQLDSFISASNGATDRALATHSRPGSSAGPSKIAAARSHQPRSAPAAASEGAISHPRPTPWRVSHDARASSWSASASASGATAGPVTSWRSMSSAPCSAGPGSSKLAHRCQQRLARILQGIDRTNGGRGRVVDLIATAGGERAEGDKGLALPCGRFDGTRGPVEPLDEIPAEREPGTHPLTQHPGGYPQHPPGSRRPAGGKVDALVIPGPESAGPPAGHIHLRDNGLLAADLANRSTTPSRSTHQKSACSPSRNSSSPGRREISVLPATSSESCWSVRPRTDQENEAHPADSSSEQCGPRRPLMPAQALIPAGTPGPRHPTGDHA